VRRRRAGAAPLLAAALLAVLWVVAAVAVTAAPAPARPALVLGHSALACVALIGVLSLPIVAALFAALRALAPTRLRAAGAAAGALAGGIAAAAYALHCDEMALPFLAVWYVLGMAFPPPSAPCSRRARCAGRSAAASGARDGEPAVELLAVGEQLLARRAWTIWPRSRTIASCVIGRICSGSARR
jgi:hypothetical protein